MELILRYVELKQVMVQVVSGTSSGTASVINKQQPLAEYTHCKNHILNLAISFACKNQSIKNFIDNLTLVCFFFENSLK